MLSLHNFMPHLRDVRVQHIHTTTHRITITATATRRCVPCPLCHQPSAKLHSYYVRTVADLPWSGVTVMLRLRRRKFYCDNGTCPRRIFCERLPALVAAFGRRSYRLEAVLRRIGLALAGRAGARLAQAQATPVGRTTLLRQIRAQPLPPCATPRVLGVDDLALRKGHTYATLLVDLERRLPVDLLPNRSAATFAAWLEQRPGIELICRDHGGAYADGARQGAPHAIQIADRWHLLANCGAALGRVVLRHHDALRQVRLADPEAEAMAVADAGDDAPPVLTSPARLSRKEHDKRRRDERREVRYREIHALYQQGFSTQAVARQLGLDRRTVQKYLAAPSCPHPGPRPTRQRHITPFVPALRARWDTGERAIPTLWAALRDAGFTGSPRRVQEQLALWRREARLARRQIEGSEQSGALPRLTCPAGTRCAPRQVTVWLSRADEVLSPAQRTYITELIAACPVLGHARTLARGFASVVRERDADAFASWLNVAEASDLKEFRDFAAGIRRDEAAVRAALQHPWSAGQTEGQVNRVKMLKRQTYGRAGFDLLRRRVLLAA